MDAYRPRLSVDSPDWPVELASQRKKLARRAALHAWSEVLFVVGISGVGATIILEYFSGYQWARVALFAAIGVTNVYFIGKALRKTTRDDVARLLIDNGYCVCGYPYQTQGVIRSCPECGRQWIEKALPKD